MRGTSEGRRRFRPALLGLLLGAVVVMHSGLLAPCATAESAATAIAAHRHHEGATSGTDSPHCPDASAPTHHCISGPVQIDVNPGHAGAPGVVTGTAGADARATFSEAAEHHRANAPPPRRDPVIDLCVNRV